MNIHNHLTLSKKSSLTAQEKRRISKLPFHVSVVGTDCSNVKNLNIKLNPSIKAVPATDHTSFS